MNYCTRCASYYHVAGTCNCYAPPISVQPQIPPTQYPFPPTQAPYIGDPPYQPTRTGMFPFGYMEGGSCLGVPTDGWILT